MSLVLNKKKAKSSKKLGNNLSTNDFLKRKKSKEELNKEYIQHCIKISHEKKFIQSGEKEKNKMLKRCKFCKDFKNENLILFCIYCQDAYHSYCLNPKIYIHQDLEKYISNIEFNNTGCEPYITPYIPKMVKIINKNALIEEEIRSHYWKYEHLFKRPKPSKTGRLMQIITSQFFPLELERQKKKNRKFEVNQDYFL